MNEETTGPAGSAGSTGSGFVSDPGPAFDAERAAAAPEPTGGQVYPLPAPEPLDEWHEASVRSVLEAKGVLVHGVAGIGQQDWLYTQADLAAIAPPLTRILNRYDVTRAAAGAADELAVAVGFGGYTMRSYQERRAVLRAREDEEEEPISGYDADPGTGPEDDPTYMATRGVREPPPRPDGPEKPPVLIDGEEYT